MKKMFSFCSIIFIILFFLISSLQVKPQCDYPVTYSGNDCADDNVNEEECSEWVIEQKEVPVSVQVHYPPDPPEIVTCTLKVCYAYRICADGVRQVDILYLSFVASTEYSICIRDCFFFWNKILDDNNGDFLAAYRDLFNIAHEYLSIQLFEEELAYAIAHGVENDLQCPNGIKSYEWWDGSCISFCTWEEDISAPEGDYVLRFHHLKRSCESNYCCGRIYEICWKWNGNEREIVITPSHISTQEDCENKPDPWGTDCQTPKEKTGCIERCE